MERKKLNELRGDEVLAMPLMTWDYQMILPEGTILRKEYINRIGELGILEVYVKERELSEIALLKQDIENVFREKVRDILERHTYQNNHELEKLSNTADSIISSILEQDQIVERVFDIRGKSKDIYEHSVDICVLAIMTALKLKVNQQKIHDIGVGCLLHDIGLRYTTLDITGKNAQDLNSRELAEYRKHPVNGYSSLKDEDWISELSKNIILYHHERMDGLGFPLRTREIPFECRIVSVCDVFDEMINGIACKRTKVYEAIEYLKGFKNVQFDGKIVDALLTFVAVFPAGSLVVTNEGELAKVIRQNKGFQDRPVIRILCDSEGNSVTGEKIVDLVKVHHVFIEREVD